MREEDGIDSVLDNADLTESIRQSKPMDLRKKVGRKPIGEKLSITLPEELINRIKESAIKRHIGYQTMLRIILAENVSKY